MRRPVPEALPARRRITTATLVGLLMLITIPARSGSLLIVGGGLDPDNASVFDALLDALPAGGVVGVLPTASSVPGESGYLTALDIETHLRRRGEFGNKAVRLIPATTANPDFVTTDAFVDAIDACDAVWFTGGDQGRILEVFRPENAEGSGQSDTPGYLALRRLLDRGGMIAGTSAGAAMMSDPMIRWGNSHEALLLGVVNDVEDFGVGVGRGMGFLPFGIVDQHFFERGRLGRLTMARLLSFEPGQTQGWCIGVAEDTGLLVDLDNGDLTVHGSGAVLFGVLLWSSDEPGWPIASSLLGSFFRLEAGGTARMTPASRSDDAEPIDWIEATSDVRPITIDELARWLAGSPRSYHGPLVVEIHERSDFVDPDADAPGFFSNFEITAAGTAWRLANETAEAAVEAERAK